MDTISPDSERPGPRVEFVGTCEEGMRSNPKFVLTRKLTELSATILHVVVVSGRKFTSSSGTGELVPGSQEETKTSAINALRKTFQRWLHMTGKQHKGSVCGRVSAMQEHTGLSEGSPTAEQTASLGRHIKGVFRQNRHVNVNLQTPSEISPPGSAEAPKVDVVGKVEASTRIPSHTTTPAAPSSPPLLPKSDPRHHSFHYVEDATDPGIPHTEDLNNNTPVNNSLSQGYSGSGPTYHATGFTNSSYNPSPWGNSSTSHSQRCGPYEGDISGDPDEAGSSEDEQLPNRPRGNTVRPKLACIYYKRDPQRYNPNHQLAYRVCLGPGFDFTSGVVRHLERVHKEYSCKKCYRPFRTIQDRNGHSHRCSGQLPKGHQARWALLWRTRFPDDPLPGDIYNDTVCTATQSARAFPSNNVNSSHSLPASPSASRGSSTVVPQTNVFMAQDPQPEAQALSLSPIIDHLHQRLDRFETRLFEIEQCLASLNIVHNAPGITVNGIEPGALYDNFGQSICTPGFDPNMLSVPNYPDGLSYSNSDTPTVSPSSRSISDVSLLSADNHTLTAATSMDFSDQSFSGINFDASPNPEDLENTFSTNPDAPDDSPMQDPNHGSFH